MPRIGPLIAMTILSLGLIAGGCGSKQSASSSSKSKTSQSSSAGQSGKSSKAASTAASKSKTSKSSKSTSSKSTSGTTKVKAPSTAGTTTATGNPTGSNVPATQLFQQKCQVCHGTNGKGGSGPKLDSGLNKRFKTQAQLATFIKSNMPFSDPGSLTEAQSSALARYLWSMQKP